MFYKNKDTLGPDEFEGYKNDALELRILQSLKLGEHLQFSGRGETSFIMFLRFKFRVCEETAIKMLNKLIFDRVVHMDADHVVHVNMEVVEQIRQKGISRVGSHYKPDFQI